MAITAARAKALALAVANVVNYHAGTQLSSEHADVKADEALIDAELALAEGGGIDNHQRGFFLALSLAPDVAYHREKPLALATLKARAAALNP